MSKQQSPALLLVDSKFPPFVGGSAVMFGNRANMYPSSKMFVLAGKHIGDTLLDSSKKFTIKRIQPIPIGPAGYRWLIQSLIIAIIGIKMVFQHHIKVVEAARPFPDGVAALIIAVLTNRLLIINYHGEDINVISRFKIERFTLKLLLLRANCSLANSSYTKKIALELLSKNVPIEIIHPGFSPFNRAKLDEGKIVKLRQSFVGSPIILTLSRLQRRKGQDMVIRTLPQLLDRFPNLRYIIAGSEGTGGTTGFECELKKKVCNLNVEKNVVFAGEISNDDVPYYYAASDLFVMPNRQTDDGDVEGFGIVFLEANSLGIPVIGGISGGVSDAVWEGDTGFLVDGNSIDAIADGIIKALSLKQEVLNEMQQKMSELVQLMDYRIAFEKYHSLVMKIADNRTNKNRLSTE